MTRIIYADMQATEVAGKLIYMYITRQTTPREILGTSMGLFLIDVSMAVSHTVFNHVKHHNFVRAACINFRQQVNYTIVDARYKYNNP